MSELRNGNLILSKEASEKLIKNLIYPDQEALEKKERFLDSFKDAMMEIKDDGTVIWDIPNLNIPKKEEIKNLCDEKVTHEIFKNSLGNQAIDISVSNNSIKNLEKSIVYKKRNRKSHSKKEKQQYKNIAFVDMKTTA